MTTRAHMLIADLQRWAESTPSILAVGLCGSYARGSERDDSDVDLIIICGEPEYMLEETAWIRKFGEPTKVSREDYGLVWFGR